MSEITYYYIDWGVAASVAGAAILVLGLWGRVPGFSFLRKI
jgi:hypothetical protein